MLVVRSLWLEKEKTIWDFYILSLLWLLVVLLAYMSGSDFSVPGEDPENPNPKRNDIIFHNSFQKCLVENIFEI